MEITTKEFDNVELITIQGRVDSVEAVHLVQALEAAQHRGAYKIVIDMSQVEYMSSAGFRALGDAQRNSKRHTGGEVVLAGVPERIHEALELVGFTEYFTMVPNVSSALQIAGDLPDGASTINAQPASPEA